MPVSDIRNRYLLSDAFHLIGRHLFGAEWQGNELQAMPCPSPDELRAEHEPLRMGRAEIDNQIEDVNEQVRRTLSADKIKQLEKRRSELQAKRQNVNAKLWSHPEPTNTHVDSYKSYQRRKTAEDTLISAIKEGKFPVWGSQLGIDPWLWSERHFQYSIELSIVRVPRTFSSRRHQPAEIPEAQFDSWLTTLSTITPSAKKQLPIEERYRRLFDRWVAKGEQEKSKKEYFQEARSIDQKLSWRRFDSYWQRFAPAKWKESGRRPWSK